MINDKNFEAGSLYVDSKFKQIAEVSVTDNNNNNNAFTDKKYDSNNEYFYIV